eukprot:2809541-Rhodomonas_salina.1
MVNRCTLDVNGCVFSVFICEYGTDLGHARIRIGAVPPVSLPAYAPPTVPPQCSTRVDTRTLRWTRT